MPCQEEWNAHIISDLQSKAAEQAAWTSLGYWSFFSYPQRILRGLKGMNTHIRSQLQSFSVLKARQVVGNNILLARNVIDFGGRALLTARLTAAIRIVLYIDLALREENMSTALVLSE